MSLKNRMFTGFAVVFAAGTLAVAGSAQTTGEAGKDSSVLTEKKGGKGFKKGGHGKGMRGGKFGKMGGGMHGLRGIDLTEVQKTQIKAIREANKPDPALREEMKSMMQSRRSGEITEDQKARWQSIREQQKQRMELVRVQIENLLTPEQKLQLETRKQEMKQRLEQRRQQWEQKKSEAVKPATVN